MIRDSDRKIVILLIRFKIWSAYEQMRLPCIKRAKGTNWIYEMMLKRQSPDIRHHAPCCPANHYTRRRLVFHNCNCGAT